MYRHDPTNPHSLSGNNVRVIYEDRADTLWFGTDSGLNNFDQETRQFNGYRHNPNDPHSLSHDLILSIYEDQAGVFWIGNYSGRLNWLDRETGKFTRYRPDPQKPGSLGSEISSPSTKTEPARSGLALLTLAWSSLIEQPEHLRIIATI